MRMATRSVGKIFFVHSVTVYNSGLLCKLHSSKPRYKSPSDGKRKGQVESKFLFFPCIFTTMHAWELSRSCKEINSSVQPLSYALEPLRCPYIFFSTSCMLFSFLNCCIFLYAINSGILTCFFL